MSNKCNTCNYCKYFNDWLHTNIKHSTGSECCSYWHIVYHKHEFAGNRVKSCFIPKNLQLQFNFDF